MTITQVLTLLLLLLSAPTWSSELPELEDIPEDFSQLSMDEVKLFEQIDNALKRTGDVENLKLAKQYMISGRTEMAQFFLSRIDDSNRALRLIRDRYQATIAFMNNDFNFGYEILSRPRYTDSQHYPHICLMRVLAMMARPASVDLQNEINRCKDFTADYSANDQFWLENWEKLKMRRQDELRGVLLSDVSYLLSNADVTRIWLKTGLYFNQEKLILDHLSTMPQSVYASPRARELLGMLYYRLGDTKQALEFLEGLESPNVENIRGNIELAQKKYELAFGHYKLALQQKENSLNALERAIPLSWILEQWDDGHEMLNRLNKPKLDPKHIQALRAALYIRQERFDYAREYLLFLTREYAQNLPLELVLMDMYVGLRTGNRDQVTLASERACQRFDGVACWIKNANRVWENLGMTMDRDEAVYAKNHLKLGELKLPQATKGLTEPLLVDQRDIEELDSEGVSLAPQ